MAHIFPPPKCGGPCQLQNFLPQTVAVEMAVYPPPLHRFRHENGHFSARLIKNRHICGFETLNHCFATCIGHILLETPQMQDFRLAMFPFSVALRKRFQLSMRAPKSSGPAKQFSGQAVRSRSYWGLLRDVGLRFGLCIWWVVDTYLGLLSHNSLDTCEINGIN